MSRRVKDVAYDEDDLDDDYDEYNEEAGAEELSAEDLQKVQQGKASVKQTLGPQYSVPDKAIEDALWDSYYDVTATVSFLKNKYKPKAAAPDGTPKQPKPPSRFDQAASAAAVRTGGNNAGPSPDDVVLNAQSKAASTSKTSHSKSKADGSVPGITNGVSAVGLEEAPRAKSKNLNVPEEFAKTGMKKTANFVVIGHVDHGKSTLMGRLLYDLKVIDQRSVDKLRKEADTIGKSSFALAWIMDSTSEERSRGVTVDIATSTFETEKTKFTILDAPGHQDFITNMIAGTSQADFAVLVIDAGTNAFESGLRGQTKEHAMLARSIGVQRLIVAVNKMDSVSWSRARFEEIKTQMTAFLTKQGFKADSLAFVPCAGLTGGNILTKPVDEGAKWYTGHTLVEELDASEPRVGR